jgi:type IX secretion system PorP/SprF family membrane protein
MIVDKKNTTPYVRSVRLKSLGFFVLLFLSLASTSKAQQHPQYTQYLLNYFLINPALAGSESYWDIGVGHRNQWTSFEGAPKSGWLSIHKPINYPVPYVKREKQRKHHGLGGFLLYDEAGPFKLTRGYLSYAYHIQLNTSFIASLGVSAGFEYFTMKEKEFVFIQDPVDELQGKFFRSNLNPNSSAGLWIYSDELFVGISGQDLLYSRKRTGLEGETVAYRPVRHYNITGGYQYKINRHYSLIPSVMVKAAFPAPLQWDVNLKARFKEVAWAGLSYRKQDAIAFLSGFKVHDKFTVGYSYDFIVSQIRKGTSGSHEIVVGIRFYSKEKIVCPEKYW